METRNLLLAIVLSMAVIFLFGIFIPSFFIEERKKEVATKTHQEKRLLSIEGKAKEKVDEKSEVPGESGKSSQTSLSYPDYPEQHYELENSIIKFTFSTKGASIIRAILYQPHYKENGGKPKDLVARGGRGRLLPLLTFRADSPDYSIPEDLPYKLKERGKDYLIFYSKYGPWEIERKFRLLKEEYRVISSTKVRNLSDHSVELLPEVYVRSFKKSENSGGLFAFLTKTGDILEGMCSKGEKVERKPIDKLMKAPIIDSGNINYTAVGDLYFISAITPLTPHKNKLEESSAHILASEEVVFGCNVNIEGDGAIAAKLFTAQSRLNPQQSAELKLISYIGPKEYNRLSASGYRLKTSIHYGWFGGLAIFFLAVLKTFYDWLGNWGLAIILLTIVIKIVLFPLTHWSYVSMRNMQAIKPLIDEINRKYSAPEDRERKNQALLELYKTHKINPMMGCLPMILQMPIWIALYSMLARSVELYHSKFFLWIDDLSQRDPYFIMPLLLGASMFLQQKLTPQTTDSTQARMMMYFMPVMFTTFMLFLPSGLNLYILVSTVLTILQQKFMYKPKIATASERDIVIMSEVDQRQLSKNLRKRRKK